MLGTYPHLIEVMSKRLPCQSQEGFPRAVLRADGFQVQRGFSREVEQDRQSKSHSTTKRTGKVTSMYPDAENLPLGNAAPGCSAIRSDHIPFGCINSRDGCCHVGISGIAFCQATPSLFRRNRLQSRLAAEVLLLCRYRFQREEPNDFGEDSASVAILC
jgi:hypothetical protein